MIDACYQFVTIPHDDDLSTPEIRFRPMNEKWLQDCGKSDGPDRFVDTDSSVDHPDARRFDSVTHAQCMKSALVEQVRRDTIVTIGNAKCVECVGVAVHEFDVMVVGRNQCRWITTRRCIILQALNQAGPGIATNAVATAERVGIFPSGEFPLYTPQAYACAMEFARRIQSGRRKPEHDCARHNLTRARIR